MTAAPDVNEAQPAAGLPERVAGATLENCRIGLDVRTIRPYRQRSGDIWRQTGASSQGDAIRRNGMSEKARKGSGAARRKI
jgi:hypothetical protein